MSTATVTPVPVRPEYARIGGLGRVDWSDAYSVSIPEGSPLEPDYWRRATFGLGGENFPVTARTPDSVIVGSDHWHINFRAVLTVNDARLTLTTVVQFNNAIGKAYMATIGPFHRRIVPRMMRKAIKASTKP